MRAADPSPSTCIYCLTHPTGSREHIILSMLGGNRSSTEIVCAECNNKFSHAPHGLDLAVASYFAPLCAQLWIFTDRGQPPAPVRNIRGSDGELYNLHPGGIQTPASQILQDSSGSPGENQRRVSLTLPTMARTLGRVPHLTRQYGDRLLELKMREIFDPTKPLVISYEISDTRLYRGLMKSLLNWLGVVAPTVARSSALDDARMYVLNDNDDWTRLGFNYSISWPDAIPFRAPTHAVVVDGRSRPGCLLGLVQIFGVLRFSAVLSTNYAGDPFSRTLLIDPWERSFSEVDGLVVPDFPENMATQLDRDATNNMQMFERCMLHLFNIAKYMQNRTQVMYGIIRGIQRAGVAAGEDTNIENVAKLIAEQVAHRAAGLPLSHEVTLDSIEEQVAQERELERLLIDWARSEPWGAVIARELAAQARGRGRR